MRILILLPHLKVAGGPRILLEYASRLSRRGHDVSVAVKLRSRLRRSIYNLLNIGPRWIAGFRARVLRVSSFTDECLPDADAVLVSYTGDADAVAALSYAKGKKFLLLQHDEGLYHVPREVADRAYRRPMKKIVVATWLKELLQERYAQDAALLINPIDHTQFRQIPRTVNDGTIRIGLLHHTYVWKGTAEGVRVVSELKKKYSNVRLVLFGARQEHADVSCDEYHYDIPQDKLAQFYSNLDIYLCPSWDEGFGLPSVEAMACGAALVTYDNGGSRDYAFHERTALVAPRRNRVALLREVERLIVDKELRSRIAAEGERFVQAMPSWDERVVELECLLRS